MAYDESAAGRIRTVLAAKAEFEELKMFGGLAFMVRSHMVCGIVGRDLMLRVGPDRQSAALGRPHARAMDFTGRPLAGLIYVAPAGFRTAASLAQWLELALGFVATLPAKPPAKAKPRKPTPPGPTKSGVRNAGKPKVRR